jgi:hypothetical protein
MKIVALHAHDATDPDITRFTRSAVLAVGAVDPGWEEAWVFGALLLEERGDVDGYESALRAAMDALPDEPWFPFAMGMSRYRLRDDGAGALPWLERAAAIPGADPGYARAADRMCQSVRGL